jgi:DNA-binding GntR family transcriptional regulator
MSLLDILQENPLAPGANKPRLAENHGPRRDDSSCHSKGDAMEHYQKVGDQMGLREPHRAFHHTLVAAAGPRVNAEIGDLTGHAERYRLRFGAFGSWEDRRAEHRAILDAAASGDADRAADRLATHYVRTIALVFGVLDRDYDLGRLRTTIKAVAPGAESALKDG